MIDHIPLSPTADTQYIVPHYYGGPLDGAEGWTVFDVRNLQGTIRHSSGGVYSLQGFYVPEGTPQLLRPWATTWAVYRWEVEG